MKYELYRDPASTPPLVTDDDRPELYEPDRIAGADLPDFMRANQTHNAIVGATWASMIPVAIAVWQLWVHFDAVTFWAAGL